MKILRRLFFLILIVLIIIGSIFYMNGNKLYNKTLSNTSIANKVSEIKNDEGFVSISEVPKFYAEAIVAVEDHRFYEHGTVDFISIGRAIVSNFKQKEFREGGSTITQQTAKNLFFISESDVVSRKVAEILVGNDLEKNYSKDEILEMYFNTIYFGEGYYGIYDACKGYLGKEPKDMNLSEATMLAGVPNAPSVYAPTININLTRSRQKKVIDSMVEYKYLTEEEGNSVELYSK